ncbi:MAG: hypothetical protein GY694_10550 [Gammaproteobacteria bacterium]|nr:hypothetical protein [Gammaproteobacteria bacterium]
MKKIVKKILFPLVSFSLSSHVYSAGFYLTQLSTPGSVGTAGVLNVTNTHSADSAWTNPAAMTALNDEYTISNGLQALVPKMEFKSSIAEAGGSDGGNAGETAIIPNGFVVKKLSDKARLGFSVTAALGGGMDYGDDFVGRYEVIDAELGGMALSPSLGYQVDEKLSIGAGLSVMYLSYNLTMAVASPLPGGTDGKAEFEDLDDWGVQPFLGLTYQINDRLLLGALYRAEFDAEMEGDIKFKNVSIPTATDSKMKIDWANPQVLEIGLKYQLDNEYILATNVNWEDWSEFSNNDIVVTNGVAATIDRNFKDTWHIGFAIIKEMEDSKMSVGFAYDSSPVDDDDRTFDLPWDETMKFSAAYGWQKSKNMYLSISSTLMYAGDAKIDQVISGSRVKGEFDKNYFLFLGGSMRYTF